MLCFIDESGDPGLKTESGSSNFFTVALVIFQDKEEANLCDTRISKLRQELSVQADFEFHFADTSPKKKAEFLKVISDFNFFYLTITVNKSALYGKGFKFPNSFYKYTCGLVFENAKPYLENATVIFDGSGSRKFKQQLKAYLKKRINEKESVKIKHVKVQDSKKNNLIQLADMVCGAVSYSIKKSHKLKIDYRGMISHREIFCQIWPKKIDENKKAEYEAKNNKK